MISSSHKRIEILEVVCSSREEAFKVQKALTTEMSLRYRWQATFLGTVGNDLSKIIVQFRKETSKDKEPFYSASELIDYWRDYSNANVYEDESDDD